MQSLRALSLTLNITVWLENSRNPHVLHVFDNACNLVNEHREVLSIVTPQIGNGPFNLVIEDNIFFTDSINPKSPVSSSANQLQLGNLITNTVDAKLWSPYPDWQMLHSKRENILEQVTSLSIANYQPLLPDSLISNLASAIANADLSASLTAARQLAGLGQGLTPAGDDFMMGALHAAWIIHPHAVVESIAREIANTAELLTTSLSAAWLRSAGKGEAGILWHNFFATLLSEQTINIQESTNEILAVGETSGADALAGFFGTFDSWSERTDS